MRTGHRIGSWLCALLLWAGCGEQLHVPVQDPRPSRDPYVEALVRKARGLHLASSTQWLRLGHYRTGVLGEGFLSEGYTSQADGAEFFLSARGKFDPQAELDATIRAFFASPRENPRRRDDETADDAHALCRFPARFIYLSHELGIDPSRLPVSSCPKFEHFYQQLEPQSITLVFSSYYLNNPASAFGHTFLRVRKANSFAIGKKRELLDYGVDFSADVDSYNAVIYALKGLTGLFPGTFKQIPYYYKVRQYNDTESRDLWEYDLALRPDQITLLVAHLWELGHTYFAYYYLSENCSYHILALVEAVTPELELTNKLASPVLPTDTVKALRAAPGLVREVRYRPSLRTQFHARVKNLDDDEQELVEELVYDVETKFPSKLPQMRQIAVLDAAADLIDIRYGEALVTKTDSDAAKRKQRLLERRAQIALPSEPLEVPMPEDKAPERGHGSFRAGAGAAAAHRLFAPELDLRVNLHDLVDASPGYPELNAIEFLHARLQLWTDGKVQLDDSSLIRVTSLTVQSRFDRKLSWSFDVGATTLDDRACSRCFAAHVGGGVGFTFAPFGDAVAFFVFTDAESFYAPRLHGIGDSGARLGLGPSGGLRLRFTPEWIALLRGQYLFLPWQTPFTVYRADVNVRYMFVQDVAVGLEARAAPKGFEGQIMTFAYF